MVLSGKTIKGLLDSRKLVIEPLESKQIQPASVDLRISGEMLLIKTKEIDFGGEQEYEKTKSRELVIPPKTHVLVRTIERVKLPRDIGGMTKLRSSLSRIGIVFNNAGWVDPGFEGTLTLSVFNSNDSPVRIKAGERFAQLILMRLDREGDGYSGKYSGQSDVTGRKKDR
jgi:dCTP deaminase